MIRLAPYIASRSALSRRQAERAILEGRVTVNGVVWRDFLIDSHSEVVLDGRPVSVLPSPMLWSYFKPRRQIVTRHDPQGRTTVFDVLRTYVPDGPLLTVGRLDYDSEGLLLVSNSPTLVHMLETSPMERCYTVHVHGCMKETHLERIRRGCTYEGIHYRPCAIKVQKRQGKNGILKIVLTEGKNREIRRLMRSAHLSVARLMRQSFGPFALCQGQKPGTLVDLNLSLLRKNSLFQNIC